MSARIAALVLLVYVLIALTGPLWAPYDPFQAGTGLPYSGASSSHLFGTDILGRDVFSRVVYGTRDVLYLALTSTLHRHRFRRSDRPRERARGRLGRRGS